LHLYESTAAICASTSFSPQYASNSRENPSLSGLFLLKSLHLVAKRADREWIPLGHRRLLSRILGFLKYSQGA